MTFTQNCATNLHNKFKTIGNFEQKFQIYAKLAVQRSANLTHFSPISCWPNNFATTDFNKPITHLQKQTGAIFETFAQIYNIGINFVKLKMWTRS